MTLYTTDGVRRIVWARADEAGRRWLEEALAATAARQTDLLLRAYSAAAKRVGRQPLVVSGERLDAAPTLPGVTFDTWSVEDGARALLLLTLAEAEADEDVFVAVALECYERGDFREQQSWLKALCLLPCPNRFLQTAIDACRTNIVPVFEAIACENAYPERYFPDLHFNQLVLKALFIGIALARIVGLPNRLNRDLTRMALDHAAERRAAGRSVPVDLPLAISEPSLTSELS
jgi:hypothetical protein